MTCQCEAAGYCTHLGRKMSAERFRQCTESPAHHALFVKESERGRYNHPAYQTDETKIIQIGGGYHEEIEPERQRQYLGDKIENVLSKIGITSEGISGWLGKECGCKERKEKLNRLHEWAESKASDAIGSLRSLIFGKRDVERRLEIACGVTSAPRRDETLPRCISSLLLSGFNPTVYAEPETPTDGLTCPVVMRDGQLGCWGNWMHTLRDLLQSQPRADAIAIFQDDAVLCGDVHDFLQQDLWPSKKTGVVSLYSSDHRNYRRSEKLACLEIGTKYLIGALAMVFPREVAERISEVDDWRGHWKPGKSLSGTQKKAVDTFIGTEIRRLGLRSYYYTPSLAQHVARTSTVGHGGAGGRRKSSTFIGEEKSVFDLLHPQEGDDGIAMVRASHAQNL